MVRIRRKARIEVNIKDKVMHQVNKNVKSNFKVKSKVKFEIIAILLVRGRVRVLNLIVFIVKVRSRRRKG